MKKTYIIPKSRPVELKDYILTTVPYSNTPAKSSNKPDDLGDENAGNESPWFGGSGL